MSGILDSKSRVIDAMLTVEGRRQMAEGTFKIDYVTFTDSSVSYQPNTETGHEDPTTRLYLEACNLPQDQIIFEANDEGKLVPFRSQNIKVDQSISNISSSISQGNIVDGRLVAYQYQHGRRVKVTEIKENYLDNGKGFIYSDISNVSGSILVDTSLQGGNIQISSSIIGPHVCYVGTKGGMGPQQFASTIKNAINQLRNVYGPDVVAESIEDSVFLDSNRDFLGTKIFATGTLSSPLLIEDGSIGGRIITNELRNASFASQIEGILTSSFDNFSDLQLLSTIDRLFEDDKFSFSKNEISFDLTKLNEKTLNLFENTAKSPPLLSSIDSIFSDDKLSHLENFMYLPPIVKTSDSQVRDKTKIENLSQFLLGDYPSWGDNESKLTYSKLINQIKDFDETSEIIDFISSNKNNLIGQMFEVTDKYVTKLDIIDFGDMTSNSTQSTSETNKTFFIGKTYLDERGTTCFVNLFTLIFSKIPTVEGTK